MPLSTTHIEEDQNASMASLAFSLLQDRSRYSDAHDLRAHCTKETCPLSLSYWAYLPSLAANGTFLALFSLSCIAFIVQSILSRRFLGFSIAMVSGSILEILGYVGRIMSYSNPFSENGFLIQIVCLTIGKPPPHIKLLQPLRDAY